jgi:hypothetical protein
LAAACGSNASAAPGGAAFLGEPDDPEIAGLTTIEVCLPARPADWAIFYSTMPDPAVHSGRVRIRQRKRRSRALPRIIIAAALAWGVFLAFYIYRETSGDDQRAVADCIEEQNRSAVGSSSRDAATIVALCNRSPSR